MGLWLGLSESHLFLGIPLISYLFLAIPYAFYIGDGLGPGLRKSTKMACRAGLGALQVLQGRPLEDPHPPTHPPRRQAGLDQLISESKLFLDLSAIKNAFLTIPYAFHIGDGLGPGLAK